MPLDISRLQHVKERKGKTIAQCPACAESGADASGEHLVIYEDSGKFGCVMHPGSDVLAEGHRRRIFELAGVPDDAAPAPAQRKGPHGEPQSAAIKQVTPVDWAACGRQLQGGRDALRRLAKWRGWPEAFCHKLAGAGVIGLHQGRIAFPVPQEVGGPVTGLHVFAWPGEGSQKAWYVNGSGRAPLLLGAATLEGVAEVHLCESQWDALSLLLASGWQGGRLDCPFVATRGVPVGDTLAPLLRGAARVVLWPQNDAPKADGSIPSETWVANVARAAPPSAVVERVTLPADQKDWNDVLRAQGCEGMLELAEAACSSASCVEPLAQPSSSSFSSSISTRQAELPPPRMPEPLPDLLHPVAPFNDAWLPESLRGWIADIAERMQCPIEFPAVAAMTALSSVAGRRFAIQPKERDTGWIEYPHLWGMLVGRPSLMKSPAMQAVLRPLRLMEARAIRDYDARDRERKAASFRLKLEREALVKKARTALRRGEAFDMSGLVDDEHDDGEGAPLRRFIVNNATIEAFGEVLRGNPNGVLHYQDELSGLLALMAKEGNADLRAFLLSAWSGKEGFTFDRIIRGTRRIEACAVSVLGGIQPGVVSSFFRAAQSEGQGDDGFMQRFALLAWPDVTPGWENIDRPPDRGREEEALTVFQTLEALTAADLNRHAPLDGDGVPVFRFAPDAQERFTGWRIALEHRLRSGELSPALEAHLGKYRKMVPALAALIHVAEWQGSGVSLRALDRALAWAACLETHAVRAYGSRGIATAQAARALLSRLRADGGGAAPFPGEFTPREVRRKGWQNITTPEEASAACEMLAEYGWLLPRETAVASRGGRPTVAYRLNPLAKDAEMRS